MVNIDSSDEWLIKILQKDARHSSNVLAKQLKVSPATVRRRVRQLIRHSVMWIKKVRWISRLKCRRDYLTERRNLFVSMTSLWNKRGFCYIRGSNCILYPSLRGEKEFLKQNEKAPKRGFNLAGSWWQRTGIVWCSIPITLKWISLSCKTLCYWHFCILSDINNLLIRIRIRLLSEYSLEARSNSTMRTLPGES